MNGAPPGKGSPSAGSAVSAPTAHSSAASVSLTHFADAGRGNTVPDAGGAIVIADPRVAPPTFLAKTTPADRLPHRFGSYELTVTAATPITHYSIRWAATTPAGSRVLIFSGALDYQSGPGMDMPDIVCGDTSADVTLAKPAEHIGVSFWLYSGIGAAATDPGPSPRVTGVTITSPDTTRLTAVPLTSSAGGQAVGSQAIPHGP